MFNEKLQELEDKVKELEKYKEDHQSSLKYQRLLELSADISSLAFWEFDLKTNIFTLNDLYYKFLNTSVEDEGSYKIGVEKYFDAFIPKESQQIVIDIIKEVFTRNSDYTTKFEYTMRRRDGVILPVAVDCYMEYDSDGKPSKSYGTKYNITTEKQREVELINEKNKVTTLLNEQKTLLSVFDKSDSILFKFMNNREFTLEYITHSIEELLEYNIEELRDANLPYLYFIHKDDKKRVLKELIEFIKHKDNYKRFTPYRLITKNNNIKWVCQCIVSEKDKDNNILHFISYLNNITELITSKKNVQQYLELIDENILYSSTDLNGNIIDISTAFSKLIGYSKNDLIGENHRILKDKQTNSKVYDKMWNTITHQKDWSGEVKNIKKDNSIFWIQAKILPINDENETHSGYFAIRQDITDKKRLEELSIIDDLTQLYNRRYFNETLKNEIDRVNREDYKIAFMMIDIDHFKLYNDTYGHQLGDETLIQVAKIIKEYANRAGDKAFRLGGEEFGIILSVDNEEHTILHAKNLIKAVEELNIEHSKNNASNYVTISAGMMFKNSSDYLSKTQLYTKTDECLYKAKNSGRNQVVIFNKNSTKYNH